MSPNFYLAKIEAVFLTLENSAAFWQNVTECHNSADMEPYQIWSPVSDQMGAIILLSIGQLTLVLYSIVIDNGVFSECGMYYVLW